MSLPVALTIAGSDSGGGAGIQADLKTFQALGVFGTSAITAVTAQNTVGVRAVHAVPPAMVREQIAAVACDFDVRAVKSGMLATRELVELVALAIRTESLGSYVLDPVMVATSGDRLLDHDAVSAILGSLLPLATVVTPNLDEAGILTGRKLTDVSGMRDAALEISQRGARAVLIKGGHLPDARIVDVLYDGVKFHTYERERIETSSTHGTGCTLSAAITAGFAHGFGLVESVEKALDFVHQAIASAPGLGKGHGPLNHQLARDATPAD